MYINSITYHEPGEIWCTTEHELIAEKGEIEQCFYSAWEEEYTTSITAIDDISDDDIELNAEDYFSKVELEKLEIFIEEMEPEADVIEGFIITLRGV